MVNKGDRRVPNEDAGLAIDHGARTLLVVADAHWGHQASHWVLEVIARGFEDGVPDDPESLSERLALLSLEPSRTRSRTTLTIGVVDRAARRGFGIQWGDSSLVAIDDSGVRRFTMPTPDYVTATTFPPPGGRRFDFALDDDVRLVTAFTDGIDQCHYRSPSTSIGPQHIARVAKESDFDPDRFVRRLGRLALTGVDGHPGGQDNLVVLATEV